MTILAKTLGAALLFLLAPAFAQAQQDAERPQITLRVEAPQEDGIFACRIPVTVNHPKSLDLRQLHVIAKAYHGNIELASTGIKTDGRPLIEDRDQLQVEYAPVPLQFDLTEEDCERITGLGVVFASCTFTDREQHNCLDRLRFRPERAGGVAFFVGEPKPPAR